MMQEAPLVHCVASQLLAPRQSMSQIAPMVHMTSNWLVPVQSMKQVELSAQPTVQSLTASQSRVQLHMF
jgi:hypothetical protein